MRTACLAFASLLLIAAAATAADLPPKKVLLIAGTKSHGPGEHEYEKGVRLLKHCLDTSPNLKGFTTEVHLDGWPKDDTAFDGAATVLLFSDGSDRQEQAHPLLREKRLQTAQKLMDRGVGFVAIHYTVFVPAQKAGEQFRDWCGGYFDYETGPKPRGWYSKIKTCTGKVGLATPKHPVSRGLKPFELREEFYYNMRLAPAGRGLSPILSVAIPDEKDPQVVAWAVERRNGGRGFGYTGGHFHKNWADENVRRMVLNALVWTARGEVPAEGVRSTLPDEERPIRALIVTGHQHPAHDWKSTTKALEDVLSADPRMQVTVAEDPEFLAKKELADHDVLVLNYMNHERPGLTAQARNGLLEFVNGGKGLVVIHFANGAFGDWPDYRKLARRAWVDKVSGHDPYGKFVVEVANKDHPITKGLAEYETTDELYFKQQGELPIEVLLTGRSKVTGKQEPMAFVYKQGKGQVFQTVLGHDANAIRNRGTAEVIRRGTAWAAGRPPSGR
jgi:type 1 glutamine amidotransferase